MPAFAVRGWRAVALALCAFMMMLSPASGPVAQTPQVAPEQVTPNFELGSEWTTARVSRLVFDTSVTPHWLHSADRFWYAYETRQGRRFYIVDPVKKAKAPLFDHAKMAAALTAITREPYDAEHLPFNTIKFAKNDASFEFEFQVPRDADIVRPTTAKAASGSSNGGGPAADEPQQQQQQQETQTQGGRGGRGGAGRAPQPSKNRTLRFEYAMATGDVTLVDDDVKPVRPPRWAQVSPDGQTIVFARDHNLYMMDAANYAKAQKNQNDSSVVETKLTDDGEEYYSFARTVMAGDDQQQQDEQTGGDQQETGAASKNARVAAVVVNWSHDSKRFTAVRRDVRKVKDLWVINSLSNPRPTLETYRYAMPGEENVPLSQLYVFDVPTKKRTLIKVDRFKDQTIQVATAPVTEQEREDARQLTVGDGQGQGGRGGQGGPNAGANIPSRWLSDSSDKIYFTRLSRDMHKMDVCLADPNTGDVKTLVEERLNTYIETKPLRLVDNGQDLVHWSERDGWGHFYLYDASSGALKNRITQGEFVTLSVEGIDDKTRTLYITAVGREPGEDPYYPHLYRVNYDGTGLKLLDPGDASHAATVDDATRYFIDNSSRVDSAPEAVLYDTLGNAIAKLDTPDLSALKEAGFKFPEPFKVKADDGVTDLYGVMYKPFDFDPAKKYPVIEYVYPGPQTESVTKTFNPRETSMSLAQYGFIVIEVGNRGGNPQRSKWYHNYGYGNLRDYGLADKKATIEQLAQRYPYIDVTRVGIWGHSGGGFMTAAALLVYPDFFKVGWSESGNHENNIYNNSWSEKHNGIKEIDGENGDVTFEYSIEKNSDLAKNLKGHLMLTTGDIDNNVHPANTFRLAAALIKANKRFDFMILPGKRHPYTDDTPYVNQRRAEYFCRYLLGKTEEDADMVELDREQQQTGDKGARGSQ